MGTEQGQPITAVVNRQTDGVDHEPSAAMLIEKLLDAVFKRKRDSSIKMRNATQRAIIEEALEKYFMQDSVQSEAN